MFIVLLNFSHNKAKAQQLMAAHNAWLQQGFDQGMFLLAGSLNRNQGGVLLAQAPSLQPLECFIEQDPFVIDDVVSSKILSIDPKKAEQRLQFLLTEK